MYYIFIKLYCFFLMATDLLTYQGPYMYVLFIYLCVLNSLVKIINNN